MSYNINIFELAIFTSMSDDSLSDEDKTLFRQMMKDVKPLAKTKKIELLAAKTITPKSTARPSTVFATPTPLVYLSDYYSEEVQDNSVLSFCRHSIPNKRLKELKNGLIPWQARLDLHGLKPEAARQILINFVLQQSNLAKRCLLIIHGKGSHKGEAPVLKNLVYHWLPQFTEILAFHSALPRDGGTGALYVLLKRIKEEKI